MEPIELPWQAIKEWIADAPLWLCRLQDPPPDLVVNIHRLNAARAFQMTKRISTGLTEKGNLPEMPPAYMPPPLGTP